MNSSWRNAYVKCAKLEATDKPIFATPNMEEYEVDKSNKSMSTPLGYWITGVVLGEPLVGSSLVIARDSRCGVKADGSFSSSVVQSIEEVNSQTLRVETFNSVYILERLDS